MPVKSIEKIKIGNYPYGQFAGGYIYSAQFSQGYSENANKLTIDIVYDKDSDIILPEKNLITSYRIEFGDLIFPQTYFISHAKNISVNEKTVSCTFTDNSILLDRYYVGLTNRHYRVIEENQSFSITVNCSTCDGSIQPQNGTISRAVADSPDSLINNLLLVGSEEYTDQACDVPDVKYNFSNLLKAMSKIPNFSFEKFIDINPLYTTAYTGTLREVISNWCSDFGFNFYWDFLKNSLVAIDLRSPIDLTGVSEFITANFDQNNKNLPISSFSEEESMEGTYQQDNIDYVLKPARTKEKTINEVYSIGYFECNPTIGLDDASMTLAKYSKEAFILNFLQGGSANRIGWNKVYDGIESIVLSKVFTNILEFNYDNLARIQIGYYTPSIGDDYASLAALCADDIGKYYSNSSFVQWKDLSCDSNSRYSISATYEPQPLNTLNPWSAYNGKGNIAAGGTVWVVQRSPVWESNTENFSMDGLGPLFISIDGEIADQVRDALLLENKNNTNADKYRGMTLLAYKPRLKIIPEFNKINASEEEFIPAKYTESEKPECITVCEKDSSSETCRQTCRNIETPAYGLVSKSSTGFRIINLLNNSEMSVTLPSRQDYIGYIKVDGSFTYVEPGIKSMKSSSNYKINDNVMGYSINLNDVTVDEPSLGLANFTKRNSINLDIVQKNTKKSISLKIIGMTYGGLNNYLNSSSGLTSLNVYLTENGIFTDLNFENRPAEKAIAEVTMQKVGPQKIRIIK